MKRQYFLAGSIVIVTILLVVTFLHIQTIYALAHRNLEIVFVVTDAATEKPIPNTSIILTMEDFKSEPDNQQVITLVSDKNGTAKFIRQQNSCEDVLGRCGKL